MKARARALPKGQPGFRMYMGANLIEDTDLRYGRERYQRDLQKVREQVVRAARCLICEPGLSESCEQSRTEFGFQYRLRWQALCSPSLHAKFYEGFSR